MKTLVLGGIFLLFIGALMLLFPETFYELTTNWKNSDPSTPSDLYKFHTRFGGIFFSLIGAAGIITYFALV